MSTETENLSRPGEVPDVGDIVKDTTYDENGDVLTVVIHENHKPAPH